MSRKTITLELTREEVVAAVAAVKDVVQCSIAAGDPTPGNIAIHDKVHEMAHASLVETDVLAFLAKLNAAMDRAVPPNAEEEEKARKRWAQLQAVAEARARAQHRPGQFDVTEGN